MKKLIDTTLADEAAERVRQNHAESIGELQALEIVGAKVIRAVELRDGAVTPIAHKLGRAPVFVTTSAPRGAASPGRIDDARQSKYRPDQYVVLQATGWGATITVDVLVI